MPAYRQATPLFGWIERRRPAFFLGLPEATSGAGAMRVYFHATDGVRDIVDPDGIEVADIGQARLQALRALEEFRRELDPLEDSLSGWRLEVVDAAGRVVLTLDLD